MALLAQQVNDQLKQGHELTSLDTEFPDFGAEVDLWAEEYPDLQADEG